MSYLIRRVPKEFAELDTRVLVRMSTEIVVADDPKGIRARQRVKALSAELNAYWRGLRVGQSGRKIMSPDPDSQIESTAHLHFE